ncbi:MAG TPA: DEAD/DEAH box helicase [Candidatus Ruania gallistercoris]|uniref:DEAD/DEAH box helicase n=1 Tax=Candidatus Ruania gallistercoris TaxID=2838746 RepID=A0A9D2J2Z8_9MICO|nr:DEAD/DEAH box helicase [Candidatus Ruania gallistercoris]
MRSRPHLFDLDRIGAGLSVSAARNELERGFATGAAVVTAPPGTGKTTVVPPLVANLTAKRGAPGRVLVTQPRRVAVRAAARRIAHLDDSALGGPVGFTVRGEHHASGDTRIEVVTPGVLLRRLLSDPGLDGVDAVILDEVHERSLEGDLLLGILAEVRALRGDLTLVAMSATVDADAIAGLIGGVIIDVPSPLHPLTVEYAPAATSRLGARGLTHQFLDHLAGVTVEAQAADDCDALVFVPTARDVDEVVTRIRAGSSSVDVLPLHGRLAAHDQDRATAGRARASDPPRIVVSTALAESSLTVPGVRLVIDAGLSREMRRDQARDMSGLVTVSVSRASAEQRAGRAARQGPGRVVRAYSEPEFAAFRSSADPEISSTDLTDAALVLAAWGTPAARGLPLLTPPPRASMARATATLTALGLTDESGRVTPLGSRVAQMPVGAREGRALLVATGAHSADAPPGRRRKRANQDAVGAAAQLDPRTAAETVAALSSGIREPGADLSVLLQALRRGGVPGERRWRAEATRLARLTVDGTGQARGRNGEPRAVRSGAVAEITRSAGIIAALARPAWIARRVSDGSRAYLFASGTRAALPERSSLTGSEWIAVCEVHRAQGRAAETTGAVIRLAAPLDAEDALRLGEVHAVRQAVVVDGRVRVRQDRRLGAILLSSTPARPRTEECSEALAAHLRENGLGVLDWPERATMLRRRLALLHRELGDPWPDVSEPELLDRLDGWLGPDLQAPTLGAVDVSAALRRILPWPEAARLADLAPERLDVPSGASVRIEYAEDPDTRPVVAVKLQEVFGLADTPRLVDSRVPVQFHLLSPARHPLTVTDDLASFWNGPYQEVRKQMRGRYPKHPWPEDPWTTAATARTNRALRGGGR